MVSLRIGSVHYSVSIVDSHFDVDLARGGFAMNWLFDFEGE